MKHLRVRIPILAVVLAAMAGATPARPGPAPQANEAEFAEVFDQHWTKLRDGYPYFERYGVDWRAERDAHRPLAVAASSPTEFAWEMARMLAVLDDLHTDYMPPLDVLLGWARPELETARIGGRLHVVDWGEARERAPANERRHDPRAYPELLSVQGVPVGSASQILSAGPTGTTVTLRVRWADGTETDEELRRPTTSNVPPPREDLGDRWVVSGRIGSLGYLRVRTFQPSRAGLGSAAELAGALRTRLEQLLDTDALILDLQGNGGGRVSASDPFLAHFLEQRVRYAWGNAGGRARVVAPRSPRYGGAVVVLVDERTGSGGEWSARILRDAQRAQVVGGRTLGAEAATSTSVASDGSRITYSHWPMAEPGVRPFQDDGVQVDHSIALTIEAVRAHGYEDAVARVRRARYRKALEVLERPREAIDALLRLANR